MRRAASQFGSSDAKTVMDAGGYITVQAVTVALHAETFGRSYVEALDNATQHGRVAASAPGPATVGVTAFAAR